MARCCLCGKGVGVGSKIGNNQDQRECIGGWHYFCDKCWFHEILEYIKKKNKS